MQPRGVADKSTLSLLQHTNFNLLYFGDFRSLETIPDTGGFIPRLFAN
jgi:hypothetical protein